MIHAKYFNELYCELEGGENDILNLSNFMSYFKDGYKFAPAYKMGFWDGKVRLMRQGKYLPSTMLIRALKWAKESDVKLTVDDEIFSPSGFDESWLDVFDSQMSNIPLRDYQREYVSDALGMKKMLCLSPTSSGKTLMIYAMVRWLLDNTEGDILITVPSVMLVNQLYDDFKVYAKDCDIAEWLTPVHGDIKNPNMENRVIVSTWQSCYKNGEEFFERFGAYICDEAHEADGESLTKINENLHAAGYRIGMTGTLKWAKTHELDMIARFGPAVRHVTTRELMDRGYITPLEIKALRFKYNKLECKAVKALKTYENEINYLVTHPGRNAKICQIALESKGNSLVLFNFVEKHGDILHEMLQEAAPEYGKTVLYIKGSVSAKERDRIKAYMEEHDDLILIATSKILSTGVSINNLHALINAHPYKARTRVLQSIGRTLRKSSGKTVALCYDIGDDFSGGAKKENHTLGHFAIRLGLYDEEKFDYDLEVVNM